MNCLPSIGTIIMEGKSKHLLLITQMQWILFTVGNVDRDIGRYSGRYSGRQSVDSRSILGRQSVDSRSIVGRQSVDTRSTLGRYSVDTRSILGRYSGQQSVDSSKYRDLVCDKKTYRFCNLRKGKDFNKKQLHNWPLQKIP